MSKLIVETYIVGPQKWKCSLHDPKFHATRLFINAPTREQALVEAKICADALGLDVDWRGMEPMTENALEEVIRRLERQRNIYIANGEGHMSDQDKREFAAAASAIRVAIDIVRYYVKLERTP